jgi:hypothetical protein
MQILLFGISSHFRENMSKFSLPKLGGKSDASDVLPPWRADFRRKDTLPDVKVVRTDFLVNYGLIGLAVVCLATAVSRELTYMGLRSEIDLLSTEITSRQAKNEKNLKDSGTFSAYMKFADAFLKFKATPVDSLRVVSELGAIKTGNMVIRNVLVDLSNVDPKTKKEQVKVMVVGVSKGVTQSNFSQVEDAFTKFKSLPVWGELKSYKINSGKPVVVANTQEQVIEFTFELTLTEASK